ncbi:MAG: hypothetical protein J5528_01645 [Firmicutes bacterium]|nr:hypothetical protein [Bacillota bacterium]
MKQFIVLLAVLPIMLLFLAQFSLEQQNSKKIALITDIVYAAKEEAKQEGGFDTEKLREELADALGADPADIIIEAPEIHSVKRVETDGSRGIIKYKVVAPMGEVNAGKKYLGIKDSSSYGYRIESSAPSEYIGD